MYQNMYFPSQQRVMKYYKAAVNIPNHLFRWSETRTFTQKWLLKSDPLNNQFCYQYELSSQNRQVFESVC